jgi:twitching motility protein PilT
MKGKQLQRQSAADNSNVHRQYVKGEDRDSTLETATSIKSMVRDAFQTKASDIHIRVGEVPRFRIQGQMQTAKGYGKTTPELFEKYIQENLDPRQQKEFREKKELDTAIYYPGFIRCRLNCFETLNGGAMVLRLISLKVPSIDELHLPPVLKDIIQKNQGLVLVTGPTGSGKSTTLAAMIRHLNETASRHIITIEDPIEYIHNSQKCLVSQRELGLHTYDFYASLRGALREDPDVILIGEMRDRTTVNIALQAAQTGHLVLGTLHTRNAVNSVNRLLNLFNPDEQEPMRVQIAESLAAVVSQLLIPTVDGGRTAVHDILLNTPAMQDYLYKGDEDSALHLMRLGSMDGMQLMNQAIYEQVCLNRIDYEEAKKYSPEPSELERLMRTGGFDAAASPRDWS